MDFDAITKALAEVNYKGEFTYEAGRFYRNMPDELIPSALKFMVEVGRYLIDKIEAYKVK